jgi:prepilin peptidase CpaA
LLRVSDLITAGGVLGTGGAGALIDFKTRRIPNALTLGTTVAGLMLAAMRLTGVTVVGALLAFFFGLLLMMPGHLIGGTGGGDVKLFASLATFLGPGRTLTAFLYMAIAGGVLAIVTAVVRGRLRETVDRTATLVRTGGSNVADIESPAVDNRFAYAPAIAIGAVVAALAPLGI